MNKKCKNDTINFSRSKNLYNKFFDVIMKFNRFCFKGFYKKYWAKYNNSRNVVRKMDKLTKILFAISMGIIGIIMFIPLIIIAPILCVSAGVSWIALLFSTLILFPFDFIKICRQVNNDYKKNEPFKKAEKGLKLLLPIEYIYWVFLKHIYICESLVKRESLHIRLGLVWYFIPLSVITGLDFLVVLLICFLLSIILSVPVVIESVCKVFKDPQFETKKPTLKSLLPILYFFNVFLRHKSIYIALLNPKKSSMGYGIILYALPLSIITGLVFLIELVICLLLSVFCSILAIFESIINIFISSK